MPIKLNDNVSLCWINMRITLKQSTLQLARLTSTSKKLLSIIWLFSALTLTIDYSEMLFTLQTVTNFQTIDSLNELAENCKLNRITVLCLQNSIFLHILMVGG